jgi:hypothetical protein
LAFVVTGHRPLASSVVVEGPGRFGRVFLYREIATRVDRKAFLAHLNDKFSGRLRLANPGKRSMRVELYPLTKRTSEIYLRPGRRSTWTMRWSESAMLVLMARRQR